MVRSWPTVTETDLKMEKCLVRSWHSGSAKETLTGSMMGIAKAIATAKRTLMDFGSENLTGRLMGRSSQMVIVKDSMRVTVTETVKVRETD